MTHTPLSDDDTDAPRQSFCGWLLSRQDQGTLADDLAFIARDSPGFPEDGDPDAVRAWLRQSKAWGDVYKSTDIAEREWLNL